MSELSELFARDPLGLTDPDIAKIVAKMREHQAQYELGIKAPPVGERKKAPGKAATAAQGLLKELGFGEPGGGTGDVLKDLGLK